MAEREMRVFARNKWFDESRKIRREGTHRIIDMRYMRDEDGVEQVALILEPIEPRRETR
jgi:hypothetical protein